MTKVLENGYPLGIVENYLMVGKKILKLRLKSMSTGTIPCFPCIKQVHI